MIPTPNPLQPPSTTGDGITRLSEAEGRRLVQEAARRAKPPERVRHPLALLTIVDADAMRELDPLLVDGDVMPFWGLSEKIDLKIATLAPAPEGSVKTTDCPLELYELVCETAGADPAPYETGGEFSDKGLAAAREILCEPPPNTGIAKFRGQLEARLRMAEAEAAWHLADPAEIAEVTGRDYVPRRSLRSTGGKAKSLALADAKARAEAERVVQVESARLDFTTKANERPLSALGLVGLRVPLDGFAQPPAGLLAQEPMGPQTRPCFVQDGATIVLWPTLAPFGLDLPDATAAGCRVLPAYFVPYLTARDLEQTPDFDFGVFDFTCRLRRAFMKHVDRGPIDSQGWTDAGEEQAAALIEKYATAFYQQRLGLKWLPGAVSAACVRGLLVRPDRCASMIAKAVRASAEGAVLERSSQRIRFANGAVPLEEIPGPSLKELGDQCAAAAESGEVEPGSLLPQTKSKKGAVT